MLVAAAVCPAPPLLVPAVASGAAAELDALRADCRRALARVAATAPDRLVVVGPGAAALTHHGPGAAGSFRGFGVPLAVRLPGAERTGETAQPLATPLAVAAWLLADARWDAAPVTAVGMPDDLPAERCAELGRQLADDPERTALLVVGGGSNCRTLKAPGYLDPRGEPFDDSVARALAAADHASLAALDRAAAADLGADGAAPWQVLAGAAQRQDAAPLAGSLLHHTAPYGVGYLVAVWH
ncbi:hypothetical protein [Streptomyces bohaiensis]|uniref:Extradiol ring-cleavage dioxygenase class III enzyme subunit B domain-containing protein n=1 Tax=Streptomyces bohaiensis TaxID=1431344 RepID=A0ABX1C640_9ACTN|nr:hypothetical protein [Streptomyces bohaiensis]NJQ13438.1 hypothetical protein [Streptomyces bohaiensis]